MPEESESEEESEESGESESEEESEESGESSEESGEESSEEESKTESASGEESGDAADTAEHAMKQDSDDPAADRAAAASASTDPSLPANATRDPGGARANFLATAAAAARKTPAAVAAERLAEQSAEAVSLEVQAALQAEEAATLPPEIAAVRRQLREAQKREEAEALLAGKLAFERLALGEQVSRLSMRQQTLVSSLAGDAGVNQVLDASAAAMRDAADAQAGSLRSRLVLDEIGRTRRRAPQAEAAGGVSLGAEAAADSDDSGAEDAVFREASEAAERQRIERAAERSRQAAAREARRAAAEETRRRATVHFESQRRDVSKQLRELDLAPPSDAILRSIFATVDQKGDQKISARELKKALSMLGYEDEKDGRCAHICVFLAGMSWGGCWEGCQAQGKLRPSGGGQCVPGVVATRSPVHPRPCCPHEVSHECDTLAPGMCLPPPPTHPQVQGARPTIRVDQLRRARVPWLPRHGTGHV
jgi:hypothetical protein